MRAIVGIGREPRMRRFCFCLILLLVTTWLKPQTVQVPVEDTNTTFKSSTPLVLVDVVVTNNIGELVGGLKSTDFELLEDNKRQTISSFEEHKATPATETKLPPMPPGVFTNFPSVQRADCVSVLLVDGLNTALRDQSYLHSQILKYLKTIPPNARVAVFTLTTRLRMLQDFTSDPSVLLAAVNAASEGTLSHSPLLQEESEKQAQDQSVAFVGGNHLGPATPQDWVHESIDAGAILEGMFAEEAERLAESRMHMTLDSMQELAHYLDGFPGRKNVMWVSGSFPILFLPRGDLRAPFQFSSIANFEGQVERTANLLAAARVAIYPVGAQGLITDSPYEANAVEIGTLRASEITQNQTNSLGSGIRDRITLHETMDELAADTGGQAFYDANGIGDVLTRVTNGSADFYTISYAPTNRKMDGRFRSISVKLARGKYKLSYRRGYYADAVERDGGKQNASPLLSLVGFGVPDVSQIVYKIRIAPLKAQVEQEPAKVATDAKVKVPLTPYKVDFAVSLEDLKLYLMPDGTRHGNIELRLVAYDDYGKALYTAGSTSEISLKPEEYAATQQMGLQLHQQIELPSATHVHLHTGVCDLSTGKVGTLGIGVLNPKVAKKQ